MSLKIDDFDPVSDGDLRELWRSCHDPFLRRVILEVVRYRQVLDKALAEAQRVNGGLREGRPTVRRKALQSDWWWTSASGWGRWVGR
jgi:hypothetical protein